MARPGSCLHSDQTRSVELMDRGTWRWCLAFCSTQALALLVHATLDAQVMPPRMPIPPPVRVDIAPIEAPRPTPSSGPRIEARPSDPAAPGPVGAPLIPGQVVEAIDLAGALRLAGVRDLDIAIARER